MKLSLRKIERVWHIIAFVLLMGAFIPLWRQTVNGGRLFAEGDPIYKAVLMASYLGVLLLLLQPSSVFRAIRQVPLVWLLLVWVSLSVTWSISPWITFARGVSLWMATLYGVLLTVRYDPGTIFRVLAVALGIVIVGSLGAVLIFPEWAVMGRPHEGAWQGVLFHKNALGRIGALAIPVFYIVARSEHGRNRLLWTSLTVVAAISVIGSRSATGIVLVVIILVAWLTFAFWSRLPRLLWPAVGALGVVITVLMMMVLPSYNIEAILRLFGKDATLTGRIPLWQVLIPVILARPLLGYGYGAFWQGVTGPAREVWAQVGWTWPYAHNGFIDLSLELGLPAALINIILIISLIVLGLRYALIYRKCLDFFPFLYGVYLLASDISESVMLRSGLTSGVFYWIIFVWCYTLVRKAGRYGKQFQP